MMPYANLHLHSTHSDGMYSPEELVIIAKKEGYKALALTDHDTATGYCKIKEACEKENMECVFGVEFSVCEPKNYHIVGFNFDPNYPPMKQYLSDMAFRQTDNTKKCFELAVSSGNIKGVTWQEIVDYNQGVEWLCNNHIFSAMMAKGLVQKIDYLKWFEQNFLLQRGYFPPIYNFKTVTEILELIDDAGGISVLAHPHMQLDDVPELMKLGLKGIEISHSMLTEAERERAYETAIKNNLFISGGTDHEGLCGGQYSSFDSQAELKASAFYLEPLSVGVAEEHFREIQNGKLNR